MDLALPVTRDITFLASTVIYKKRDKKYNINTEYKVLRFQAVRVQSQRSIYGLNLADYSNVFVVFCRIKLDNLKFNS